MVASDTVQPATDSLERLVPDTLDPDDATGRASFELHLERYRFAAQRLRPGRVLDIACGVGYGTSRLAEAGGGEVDCLGVDVSEQAVGYARSHYGGPGVAYRVGDAMTFEDAEGFDLIVSLETVEHVPDPTALLGGLARLLRPGGTLVASVPTTPTTDLNPHHLHDFSERSFRDLVAGCAPQLAEVAALPQVQPVSVLAVLRRSEARMGDLRRGLVGYYASHPGALLRRLGATLRFGFNNRHLTIAWTSPEGSG